MKTPGEKCFVEQFHLRSPVEEFEEYSRTVIENPREGSGHSDDSTYREAIALVLSKLRPGWDGNDPLRSAR